MRDIPTCKWLDQWTELAQRCVLGWIVTRTVCVLLKVAIAAAAAISYYNVHTHKGFHKFLGSFHCRFAFQYNPSLQPRALVVFGCISKRVSHGQIKQIIRILSKVPIPLFPKICSNLQCILQGFKNTLKRNKCYWHCNYIFVKHLNFFSYCNSLKWWNLT